MIFQRPYHARLCTHLSLDGSGCQLYSGSRQLLNTLTRPAAGTPQDGAIMLTKKWAFRDPELLVGGHAVPFKRNLRYLELHLHSHLTISSYLWTASSKSTQTVIAQSGGSYASGPSQAKKALLRSVVLINIK